MLTEEQFIRKWKEIKGGIRALWGRIEDHELDEVNDFNEVTGLVEDRYGETREEIKKKLQQLMDSFDNDSDKNFTLDQSSYERSPIQSRTSSQSQIEDAATDITTRSAERHEFEEKTFHASREEMTDPSHHSNYSGANPGRERLI